MIDTQSRLLELLPQLGADEQLALDTEADSLHAYPEKLCLIQLSDARSDWLIDPLAGLDLSSLLEILRKATLIFHGADYDLRLLYRAFGFVPKTVFDTMWAARLLGYQEFGLRHLVQQHLGLTLEKGPQKMNWALRPLTERMATYALNDTRYLRPLAKLLAEQLLEKGRLSWHQETCRRVIEGSSKASEQDPDDLWRIKGSDRLERPAMAVLREIWQWREREALAANKPPYFILSHELLVVIAAAAARGKATQDLIPYSVPAKRWARLAAAIDQGLKTPASKYPERRRFRGQHLNHEQQHEFERLKGVRDERAHQLGLDPTIIASKADLAELARTPPSQASPVMSWQRALLFGTSRNVLVDAALRPD